MAEPNADATRCPHCLYGPATGDLIAPCAVPEPLGFGAVIEDYDGAMWVRVNATHWHSEASPNNRQTWGELSPRRVLSVGVQIPNPPGTLTPGGTS